jgi:3-demethoxyubiquinol 3-hydroxylase
VIDEHYASQVRELGGSEPELAAKLEEFRRDELAHRDEGLAHEAEQTPAYELLSSAIKAGSRLAIWLSTRV